MTAPRLLPMPNPEIEDQRLETVARLLLPTALRDPAAIRSILQADYANRAAYIAWHNKLLADAAMYSRHAANCLEAAETIRAALDAQKAVAV